MSDNSLKGYIAKAFDSQNSYTFTSDLTSAQKFKIPANDYYNTIIDVAAIDGPSNDYSLLGSVGGSGGFTLGSSQTGYVLVYFNTVPLLTWNSVRQIHLFGRRGTQFVSREFFTIHNNLLISYVQLMQTHLPHPLPEQVFNL